MRFPVYLFLFFAVVAAAEEVSPTGTQPLELQGDIGPQMISGMDKFLMRELEVDASKKSVQPDREKLRSIIGATDRRLPVTKLEFVSTTEQPAKIADTGTYEVHAVRWPVFEDVHGEGLWLKPKKTAKACIVAIPDADQTPEMLAGLTEGIAPESQFARRFAENGCEVLIPTLINRDDTFSGNPKINRFTNQPHREWIYRQSYELGRHIIGYEVQKVHAAVDWFARNPESKIAVAGYAEGGLIAFYAAALDERIQATLVSGYFDSRKKIWREPIYRNVFGLLRGFSDAEIATLIAPRALIIEHSSAPKIDGPPTPRAGHAGAAPGRITTPEYASIKQEFDRARSMAKSAGPMTLVANESGTPLAFGSSRALSAVLLQVTRDTDSSTVEATSTPLSTAQLPDRQYRQVNELVEHTQRLLRESERVRQQFFWSKATPASPAAWDESRKPFQEQLWNVLGKINTPVVTPNARSRKIMETESFIGHDVVLDVFPDVIAWGVLLLPKDLKPGERRPVVVCQHGLEGSPADVITTDPNAPGYHYYKGFGSRLAERGFVVFVPQNPYRGGDSFRILQRKANPLGISIFSFIIAQHDQILTWLSTQPYVDPQRIGFYGLSYGGKTAVRVPPLLDRYALSICSGDYNEWIYKNVTIEFPASYMFTAEHEMAEWNLGSTFGYAEMSVLMAPRPFMVERGHSDGVAIDEWVSYEYAKVRRFYDHLGIGDRTEIEYFVGPHTINGKGTFAFLHKHLKWPER